MFWEHGYEGVDVDRIARAVNVTKPALYRAFGDKSTLLLRAVERYAMTYGAPKMAGFSSGAGHPQGRDRLLRGYRQHRYRRRSRRLHDGRRCGGTVGASNGDPFLCSRSALAAAADIFAKRFEQEMKGGRLTRTPPAKVRGRVLVDLMQGCSFAPRPVLRASNCCKTPEAMCP